MATSIRRTAVLSALTTKPQTVEQIAELSVFSVGIVRTQLQALAEAGVAVARPNAKTGTTWKLTKAGAAEVAPTTTAPSNAQEARRAGRATKATTKATASGRKLAEDIKSGAYVPGGSTPRKSVNNDHLSGPATSTTTRKARKATSAPAAVRVPRAPEPASKPASVDLGAVVGFMEEARPVSAQPATPVEPRKRTRRAADAPRPVFATFARGQLRDAVLSHLQARPADAAPCTATDVAKALNAQTAPVATNLDRMTSKGLVSLVATEPRRYVAA